MTPWAPVGAKNLDPCVIQNIKKSKFPGCSDHIKIVIIMSERVKEIVSLFTGIIKIGSKYVDLFKDTALTFLMLEAIGGNLIGGVQSIGDLPTSFSCVLVLLMFGSIVIPVFLSTLHLVVNRKLLIEEKNLTRVQKYFCIVMCWFCSFLNPIILDAYYHELKEDVRKMTQKYDTDAIRLSKKCRNIKREVVQFHKIELGENNT